MLGFSGCRTNRFAQQCREGLENARFLLRAVSQLEENQAAAELLDSLHALFQLPAVIVFVSPIVHEDYVPVMPALSRLQDDVVEILNRHPSAYCFASPVSVADIVFLEAVLSRGWKYCVVLPVPLESHLLASAAYFRTLFVTDTKPTVDGEAAVAAWMKRLHAVVSAAAKVEVSNDLSLEASVTNLQYCRRVCRVSTVLQKPMNYVVCPVWS
jgi:hypothetical protein